ncbi:MAG: S4 domain-containing protein, partial [bacterium]|nr:S4 domain-containing protein [bacterium]
MRVDLWLFQARLFKSRTQATTACKEGKVYRSERKLDAADEVKAGELIELRERGLYRSYRILTLPLKNMSKELSKTTYQDETKEEVLLRYK